MTLNFFFELIPDLVVLLLLIISLFKLRGVSKGRGLVELFAWLGVLLLRKFLWKWGHSIGWYHGAAH
jgi:hypothetical protein